MSNSNYFTTIGLEVHAELKTATKMFCNSKNDTEEKRPNVNVCPICMGHPGTLPVINREAVKHILKIGTAVGGVIADFTEFDRKNYFYPDIPKGYQISQYKFPLVKGGKLRGVSLTRIHLEEDTAKSTHDVGDAAPTDRLKDGYSLVDFNRAGVPLMELVTEPVVRSAEEAVRFARELQLLLRYLGIADANMEKGEMRVEANISVSPKEGVFGTKVEVKNLNSFRAVERAIAYEVLRHTTLLEEGNAVIQETRGWDESKQTTFSQRRKEESHDYRYFPDPDLPKLSLGLIPEWSSEALAREIPELPWQRRERLAKLYALKAPDIEMYVENRELGDYFEEAARALDLQELAQLASNYITSDIVGLLAKSETPISRSNLDRIPVGEVASVIRMITAGVLSSRGAKDVLAAIFADGGSAETQAKEKNLIQQSNEGELEATAREIMKEHPKVVDEYRGGKEASLQYLIGQGMKRTKGSANPEVLKKIFKKLLK
ncbi:MAG: Asp-tRNA(Asn)/Glu-tRNA(Gln) amidotransferase subunit GatB [bacterium]|nr:Asp-tRNA(Asn)/Glu-tRNA(Gln) amidotransferase subunit GatB [bacterium]